MAFRGRFAALTMATDVTERRRVEHRNQIFSKLSHRLSSATTAAEAAMIICEAADALFKWDDFALDLYSAESDEVFSLLNITTVEGQRVEIPSSLQPKAANALIRRVVSRGAELLSSVEAKDHSTATMLAPIRKGRACHRRAVCPEQPARLLYGTRFGNAPDAGRPVRRRARTRPRRARIARKRAAFPRPV